MDRFQEMKVLLAVADAESFAGGAKQLGLSPPSVTRAIAALEQRLGTLLLARSTRSVRLTEAGRRYAEDCRRILQELEEAEELAAGSALRPRGNLTVTAPVLFGELYMVPLITEFLAAHAEVTVHALLVDRVVNLIDEGIDVAVRIGQLPEGEVNALKVGAIRPVICAAPAFLDRIGRPAQPTDLLDAPVVMSSSSVLLTDWQFEAPDGALTLRPQARFVVTSNNAAIHAAKLGWGFTRVLSYQVADAVARGELEIVLDAFAVAPLPIHLLQPGGARASAKVRAFIEHCAERLRNNPALQMAARD